MTSLNPNTFLTLAIDWASVGRIGLIMLFLVACLFLVMIVLIQRPQGGGLAGAFGSGAGSGQTAFGARTGDALTVATILFFLFYLVTAVLLSRVMTPASAIGRGDAAALKESAEKPAAGDAAKQPGSAPAGAPATTPGTDAPHPAQAPAGQNPPVIPAPADGAATPPAPAPAANPTPGSPAPAQQPPASNPGTPPPATPPASPASPAQPK